ncbi:MAG: hypothetical protein HKO90_03395 [Flavobacteriaceae bacterium]|nr:hypothetical protein [Flavobacteriaceae bacterium]
MLSKQVLKEALIKFEGTLILVSHDREFLQGLVNKVYEFKDRKIKEFLGGIDFYLEQRNLENLREAEIQSAKVQQSKKSGNRKDYENQKRLKSIRNKISKKEAEISELESKIKAMDIDLETNYDHTVSDPEFFDRYQSRKTELDQKFSDWEKLQNQLSSLSDGVI